jgi:hypothetical protein
MPVFDIFSKRQRAREAATVDVFRYDGLPHQLRVQIVHIWSDALGNPYSYLDESPNRLYQIVRDILCREYGVFGLAQTRGGHSEEVRSFFLSCDECEQALDVIELVFRLIDRVARKDDYRAQVSPIVTADEAIEELNARFLEHAVGYQYESGNIIRKDSEILHQEVVRPTLELLHDPVYNGANEEFLAAHEHYRHRKYKESLNECLKAFESTMKAICHKRGWSYNQNDTAKRLIEICISNGLVPTFLQSQLESGIPTVRNKLGGHGQGAQQQVVSPSLASYSLHLTATTVLFLIRAEKDLP